MDTEKAYFPDFSPGSELDRLVGALGRYKTTTPIRPKAGDVIEAVCHAGFLP